MKIRAILFVLVMVLTPTAKAATNPCRVVLCMFGMVAGGDGASQCAGATAEFFAIQIYDFWGTFDPIATAIERRALLNGCSNGVEAQIDSIIAMFGEVQ